MHSEDVYTFDEGRRQRRGVDRLTLSGELDVTEGPEELGNDNHAPDKEDQKRAAAGGLTMMVKWPKDMGTDG